jgi:phytoene synthase
MTRNVDDPSPTSVLRKHGKSFYWASIFLGSKKASQAARLYSFCRKADDIADNSDAKIYRATLLQRWKNEIQRGQSEISEVNEILSLMREINLDTKPLNDLLDGLISDLTLIRIADQNQLINYCYLVAGTVGLMMCKLLGAVDEDAKKFAIDLGIAMQLTNILRDVGEDAHAGRQYIPVSWASTSLDFFERNPETSYLAQPLFQRLHDLAEVYYKSAYAGMIYLPWRSRLSIMIAARLYQEIGLQARREGFPVLTKRIIVKPLRKIQLVFISILTFNKNLLKPKIFPMHSPTLHCPLTSWPQTVRMKHEC